MNNKKTKSIKIIVVILIVVITVSFLLWRTRPYDTSSYQHIIDNYSMNVPKSQDYSYNKKSDKIEGYDIVSENEYMQLAFNKNTYDVAIYDKATKQVFNTLPQDAENDVVANGYEKNYINSHFLMSYYDELRKNSTYLSYTDSVLTENVVASTIENGVRLTYNIGDFKKDITFLPELLTEDRMNELVSQMDESGVKFFNKYYFLVESGANEGLYERKTNLADSKINTDKMIVLFEEIGYDDEQLALDNELTGLEVTHSKPTFSISIDYVLEDNKLNVSIPNSLIEESNGKIAYIDFMPFFVSSTVDNTGYFVLPDGSGSIMEFNQNKKVDRQYMQPIYDFDRQNKGSLDPMNEEKITMPVFGMSSDSGGVFVRITEGAANTYIVANESGKTNSYNNVFPRFNYRDSGLLTMSGVSGAVSDLTVLDNERTQSNLSVDYMFYSKDSGYVDFAKDYREQLIEEGVISQLEDSEDIPLYLDIIGGISARTYNFIFVDMSSIVGATYEQTLGIIEELNNDGINNVNVNVKGWFNNGTNNDYAGNIKLIKDVGSKKDLLELNDYLNQTGGKLFLETNFVKTSVSDKKFDEERMGSRLLSGYTAVDGPYSVIMRRMHYNYINSAGIIKDTVDSFLKDYKKNNLESIGVNANDLSSMVASDKNKNRNIDRTTASNIYAEGLEILDKEVELMVNDGNEYSLKYSQNLKDVSIDSNEYAITDYGVPFKQIVLHGYVNMASRPINDSSMMSKQHMVLKLLETGVYPDFMISEVPTIEFKFTSENNFSTEYSILKDDIQSMYFEINEVLKNVYNVPIENHVIDGDIVTVTYENGDVIVLNYGDKKVATKYGDVEAINYIYKGGDR